VLERVPPSARIALATAGFDTVAHVRTRFPARTVVQFVPNFMAHFTDDVIRVWVPPIVKSVVSDCLAEGPEPPSSSRLRHSADENHEDARAFATELAAQLTTGGLPTTHSTSAKEAWERNMALGIPLLAAWEVSGWDIDKLAHSSELRTLAARSAREALDAVGSPLLVPAPLISATLRALPLAPKMVREMLQVHGPKIAGQTRMMLDDMLARAAKRGRPVDNLHALRSRL
jgi:hypothetical protein